MSSEVEFLIKLRDAAAMILDASEGRLEALAPTQGKTSDSLPDMSMIAWKNAIGSRGGFEVAEVTSNKDSMSFKQLQQVLREHNRGMTISGYFVWLFSDSSGSIGRKRKA
jgi:hypothetical protein